MDVQKTSAHISTLRKRVLHGAVLFSAIVAIVVSAAWLIRSEEPTFLQLPVERGAVDLSIDALGELRAKSVMSVTLEVSGTVQSISAAPGDRLSKGARIGTLTNMELEQELAAARYRHLQARAQRSVVEATSEATVIDHQASLLRAEASFRFAESEYAAKRSSFDKGVISRLSLEESSARLEAAQTDQSAARKRLIAAQRLRNAQVQVEAETLKGAADTLDRLEYLKSRLIIVSPVDGVLGNLDLEVGQAIEAGTSIGRIIEPKGFSAMVRVPEDLASMVEAGSAVNVEMGAKEVVGTVERVNPVVTEGFRLVEISIDAIEPSIEEWADGTSLRASIRVSTSDSTLSVEAHPATTPGQAAELEVLSGDGEIARREVVFGRRIGSRLEVVSGAQRGDTLRIPLANRSSAQ